MNARTKNQPHIFDIGGDMARERTTPKSPDLSAHPCTSWLIAWIESVISILYSRCVIHSILRNVLSLNLNQSDFISRFPRSIKYGTVPPIAITWWDARSGGPVTTNVVLYLNKAVTEKCTLTTLILMHFPMML